MADTIIRKTELLAPAGDMEGLNTAIKYGADAVYLGGPFMQLRAASAGFNEERLALASDTLHKAGKRLFVTVNSFAENSEIPKLDDYARFLKDIGADAVIVSDIGAIAEIKSAVPDLEVHLSTQANCMNYKAAEVYYNMGVKRIVLARELSIPKIAELRAKAPVGLELEAFIHGAMCMSYSGRCLLSAYLTGRSGNRGLCAQTCRWNYYLMEETRPGEYFKIEETEHGSAILSSKELCAMPFIEKLQEAGVCSFKIEGRMRTPFYTATVVNAYRLRIDGKIAADEGMRELDTVSHRPFTSGFYLSENGALDPDMGGYVRDWLFVATVLESDDNTALIETRNPFSAGDSLEVLSPGNLGRAFSLEYIKNEDGESLERSNTPMRKMHINLPFKAYPGDIIRKYQANE